MLFKNYQLDICAVCCEQSQQIVSKISSEVHYICSICGEYYVSKKFIPALKQEIKREKRLDLSNWVSDKNHSGEVPHLTLEIIKAHCLTLWKI